MNKLKTGLFLLSLLLGNFVLAQDEASSLALVEVLRSIESQYNVRFSYASEDVEQKSLKPPSNDLSLQEVIQYLNDNTILQFSLLDDQRYVTVSTLNKHLDICGVLMQPNGEPLFGASIYVRSTELGTISNTSGEFQLQAVPSESTVVISFVGFKTLTYQAKDLFLPYDKCVDVVLLEAIEELNEVIITKFLTTGLQKRIDGSMVLNTEKFGVLPGLIEPDILQSVQALPGVESVNESIANINVRGGTNDQNLMLWDGIKMYHSGHFFGLISAYNPNLTTKVVVTKNGTSSQYSDGVSSTINMFTKDDIDNQFSGGVGLNLISADAFLEIPIVKDVELHISGRRSFTDLFNTPTYDEYFERSFQDSEILVNSSDVESSDTSSEFYFYDVTAKLLFDINEDHKFRANFIGINNNLDYAETITDEDNETQSKFSNLRQENIGSGAYWQAQWSDKLSTKLEGFYSNYLVDAIDRRIETDQQLTQTNEVLETGVKFLTNYKLNESIELLFGYQFNETGILNETTVSAPVYQRTKKDVLLNHAVFGEAEYNKGNLYLRAGVRVNYFEKFKKTLIEPRLVLRHKLGQSFAFHIAGEFKNQSATQIVDFQDDFLGVENRRWILADEQNIPIATSQQLSAGLAYDKSNLNIELTGYYKEVEGITASNQGFYNNFQYLNATGSYLTKGIEFLINKTTDRFSTWMSYTYAVNDYTFESFDPSDFPNNNDIRHSASLAFNYNIWDNVEVSLGGLFRTGRPYTQPVEGNETIQTGNTYVVNYDTPNAQRLDDFVRLDASLNYEIQLSRKLKANLRAGVLNLLNRQNMINRYYEVNPNNQDETIQIDNKALGLTPNVSLRLNF